MSNRLAAIFLLVLTLFSGRAFASHIVGGEVTYRFLGPAGINYRYEVRLTIYEDCQNGQPEAIAQDNPAYLAVYAAGPSSVLVRADSVSFDSSVAVPANFSNSCVSNIPATCLLKKSFKIIYTLPPNGTGYIIDYQRCCRNGAVMNIRDPSDQGSTYFCYIPSPPTINNSAVFSHFPPQIICLNNPLVYDHSATDADGDSLAYGFSPGLLGATNADIKPWPPTPPPFDTVMYLPPFNSQTPMTGYPPIQINPTTGIITGTPNRIGRYLVTVFCDEYRDGILINRVTREFQFVVTDCSKVVVADIPQFSTDPNTYIVNCEDYTIHFVNTSTGGFSYKWDFGLPGNGDTSSAFEPTFTYPDTGTFTVKLVVNPGSTCPDSISRYVKVYPKFHSAFVDSGGQCPGAPIYFFDRSTASIKPITYWEWHFGDGDSTYEQNPQHTYKFGGVYNVMLISHNIKNCADTAMHQVYVDNFAPFAGDDTIIVKGETIHFHAVGGTSYTWSPPDHLNDTSVSNPTGYFPDTGSYVYYVHITSPYGCTGYDTLVVHVVNQAAFFVPNAFTPNGDGLNDIFKPEAIGYRSLNYFRVFNRWGQEVYHTSNLETGWDGTFNKKQCDMGTYYWEISFVDRFGTTGTMKGDVELIR